MRTVSRLPTVSPAPAAFPGASFYESKGGGVLWGETSDRWTPLLWLGTSSSRRYPTDGYHKPANKIVITRLIHQIIKLDFNNELSILPRLDDMTERQVTYGIRLWGGYRSKGGRRATARFPLSAPWMSSRAWWHVERDWIWGKRSTIFSTGSYFVKPWHGITFPLNSRLLLNPEQGTIDSGKGSDPDRKRPSDSTNGIGTSGGAGR